MRVGIQIPASHRLNCIRQFHYLIDVIRTGSLHPSNPIKEDILQSYQDSAAISEVQARLPKYSEWRPHYLVAASEEHRIQHDAAISLFRDKLQSFTPQVSTAASKEDLSRLSDIVSEFDNLSAPLFELHSSCYLFCLTSSKKDWVNAFEKLSSILPNPMTNMLLIEGGTDPKFLDLLRSTLEGLLAKSDGSSIAYEEPIWAARYLERTIRHSTGAGMPDDDRAQFEANQTSLKAVEERIIQLDSSLSKEGALSFLSDAYSMIDLRLQNAQLLGYSSFGEQVFAERMASEKELRDLHEDIALQFLPLVASIQDKPFDFGNLESNGVVHPTLNGCLLALCRITSDLFGVEIREETNDKETFVWHRETRLFRVYDNDSTDGSGESLLGSFILDPFKRPGKANRSFLVPLRHGTGKHRKPLVGISLEVVPPIWDDSTAVITWDDAEALFHEAGHALHFMLGHRVQHIALDLSEILPKFMEHCLFESLHTVMEFSESDKALSSEMVDVLLKRRSQQKALQIMQHVFFGSLELELFTSFDPKGEESLVGVQRRLAAKFLPHDMPSHNDLTPLLDVFRENSSQNQLGLYRYLWSEVYCAGIFQCFLDAQDPFCDRFGNTEKSKFLGGRLRRDFLDKGASFDAQKSLREFNGKALGSAKPLYDLYSFESN